MKVLPLLLLPLALISCRNFKLERISENPDFRPPEGYIYVFAGETPEAVGGVEPHADGYCDHVGMPAGISFTIRLGESPEYLQLYAEDSRFKNVLLTLTVDFSGLGEKINAGKYDGAIDALGQGIKESDRPVFLQIGGKAKLPDSSYNREEYTAAYKRIADRIRLGAPNRTVLVWHAFDTKTEERDLSCWYPGDEYCDWIGMTVGKEIPQDDDTLLRLSEEKDKPLMITSACPMGFSFTNDDPEDVWTGWFEPFIDFTDRHRNRIAAVVYMGVAEGTIPGTDTMFQASPELLARWQRTLRDPGWIHRSFTEAAPADSSDSEQ